MDKWLTTFSCPGYNTGSHTCSVLTYHPSSRTLLPHWVFPEVLLCNVANTLTWTVEHRRKNLLGCMRLVVLLYMNHGFPFLPQVASYSNKPGRVMLQWRWAQSTQVPDYICMFGSVLSAINPSPKQFTSADHISVLSGLFSSTYLTTKSPQFLTQSQDSLVYFKIK